MKILYDIGPAVHQGAGLAKYAERLLRTCWPISAPRWT